ncbi:MAG: hypothetical protein AAF267_23975, partial [Deinococcota bacterium]
PLSTPVLSVPSVLASVPQHFSVLLFSLSLLGRWMTAKNKCQKHPSRALQTIGCLQRVKQFDYKLSSFTGLY